jgi:zinc-dependent metalloproteinase lipoprotein
MKKIFTLFAFASSIFYANSQAVFNDIPAFKPKKVRCFTVEAIADQRKENPSLETDAQFESWMSQSIAQRKSTQVNGVGILAPILNYYLPIVYHIIHPAGQAPGTGVNVTADMINATTMQLNKDYANLSGSTFSVASTTGIQFGMATTSPTGATLAEPGIDRIDFGAKGWTNPNTFTDATTLRNYMDGTVKPASIWDPLKYINIWICDMNQSGLLGYASFPASSTLSGLNNSETNATAGVVAEVSSLGSIFTSPDCGVSTAYNMGRTLTHELGHFFGLRHIWGDNTSTTTCAATDYCADTPTAFEANYGKYVHPKMNICSIDEMFENYMDYCDDQVLNTFTLNQVDRMQVVMIKSPRRKELAISTVGKVLPTNVQEASFANCTGVMTVSEKGTTGTTNRYTDVKIPISINGAATDVATLTFGITTVSSAALAVDGVDYQILTPTINYVAGEGDKNLIIRVFDNAKIDGHRGIGISLNVAGTGLVAGNNGQTMLFFIDDDDNVVVGQKLDTIINEAFAGTTLPIGWTNPRSAGYGSKFVVGAAGAAGGTAPNAFISSGTTNVYSSSPIGRASLQPPTIEGSRYASLGNLSFKYRCRGSYNATYAIPVHFGALRFSTQHDPNNSFTALGITGGLTGNGPYYTTAATPISGTPNMNLSSFSGKRFNIAFYWEVLLNSTAASPGLNIDDVVFTATPFKVDTTLSSSFTFATQATKTHTFRSSTSSRMIATVAAQNADVADVVASVVEVGIDRPTFTSDATTFMRSRKVIKIAPAVANTTTTNTVTMYFTKLEMAAWGGDFLTAKLMKVNSGVNIATDNITVANAVIAATTTITNKLATQDYVAFTATFTGYGQYVLVEPTSVLPLSFINISGYINNNIATIKFTTTNEINCKSFDIEKSIDGVNFAAIANVAAKNAKENSYTNNDVDIAKGVKYYYRIKQIDNNGKFSYSSTISLIAFTANKFVNVYPNPVKSVLFIELNNAQNVKTEIVVTDVIGQKIYASFQTANKVEINTNLWSKGVYMVAVKTAEGNQVFKVIKE